MALLKLEKLGVSYGGIEAVNEIDLEVREGELVCLLGANGAGKTSTLRACCGLVPISKGEIRYRNYSISSLPTHALSSLGLVMVPEGRGLFTRMSVQENLEMGAYARRDGAAVKADIDYAYGLFPRLAERRRQKAGTLSGGEQQMLAIARALISRPRLLLLDEPSMGLAPLMVQKIFEVLKQISQNGTTMLLVEQNAQLSLSISHRAYVMESGSITLQGCGQELLNKPEVRYAYLGE